MMAVFYFSFAVWGCQIPKTFNSKRAELTLVIILAQIVVD
jgi:hypothetical protein